MTGIVHVIGAGLAGLAAAVRLADEARRVVVHEAAPQAGGRCRSYHDPALDLTIDNGNHLLLSGNWAARDYLGRIGAPNDALEGPEHAAFPFADLATGERWTLRPNDGRLPWWVFDSRRRVPESRARDYAAPLRLLHAPAGAHVGEVMACTGPLYERLWRPVLLAALNTEPSEADARLAGRIMRETLGAGGRACRPLVAKRGLSDAFVVPALRRLERAGVPIRFGHRLRTIGTEGDAVARLDFGDGRPIALGRSDSAILAVPAWIATELVADLAAPSGHRAIVNAHFRMAPPPGSPSLLGIVNGLSEWLFAFPDRLSVTISCADRLLEEPREALARAIWEEVAALSGLAANLPPWQIVKERRATFAATPVEAARRPAARTRFTNLALAGDWTDTGLPATIEGAVRSGYAAAALVQTGSIAAGRVPAAA
jgi:hydroxysqualene dehydroxylase